MFDFILKLIKLCFVGYFSLMGVMILLIVLNTLSMMYLY